MVSLSEGHHNFRHLSFPKWYFVAVLLNIDTVLKMGAIWGFFLFVLGWVFFFSWYFSAFLEENSHARVGFLSPFSNADSAEKLFDLVDGFAESTKRKAAVWPLQIILLVLCPEVVQDIVKDVVEEKKINKVLEA